MTQANTMLQQVASLNVQISDAKGAGSPPNALIDQQNEIMSQLATSIGAVSVPQSDGTVNVDVGGITLVQGSWSDTINATGGTGAMSLVAQSSGATIPASSGSVSGQLAAINQYLPAYQSQLDATANDARPRRSTPSCRWGSRPRVRRERRTPSSKAPARRGSA